MEPVAERERLLLVARAANADCPRPREQKSQRRRGLVGPATEQVVAEQRQRKPAKAKAGSPPRVDVVFLN